MNIAARVVPLFLIAASVHASELQANVADVTTITDGAGHSRILFRGGPTEAMSDVAVRKASLRWTRTGGGVPQRIRLQIHPITTPWNAETVAWGRGWTRPGGDFDESLYGRCELDLAAPEVAQFDLTMVFKEILEHGHPAHGFLLTVDPADGLGLPDGVVELLGNLSAATLEVEYRRMPPVPPNRRQGPG